MAQASVVLHLVAAMYIHQFAEIHAGILDVFGFESLSANHLEQLCINYANERLQHFYIHHTFALEQQLFAEQGLTWSDVTYTDNKPCVSLIDGKTGIFNLINEVCFIVTSRFPKHY